MRSGKLVVLVAILALTVGLGMVIAVAAPTGPDTAWTSPVRFLPAVFKNYADTTWISPVYYLPAVYKNCGPRQQTRPASRR